MKNQKKGKGKALRISVNLKVNTFFLLVFLLVSVNLFLSSQEKPLINSTTGVSEVTKTNGLMIENSKRGVENPAVLIIVLIGFVGLYYYFSDKKKKRKKR